MTAMRECHACVERGGERDRERGRGGRDTGGDVLEWIDESVGHGGAL
jgi:hypothetical protein